MVYKRVNGRRYKIKGTRPPLVVNPQRTMLWAAKRGRGKKHE